MNALIPIQDRAAARRFLDVVDPKTVNRGRQYFTNGAVRQTSCVKPGVGYQGHVQGSLLYTTTLTYQKGEWYSSCTCPIFEDCKHAVALMLALLNESAPNGESVPAVAKLKPSATTTIEAAAIASLHRALSSEERHFIKRVQQAYRDCRHYQMITAYQLLQIFPRLQLNRAEQFQLWPQFPASELEFWQYLACWLPIWGERPPVFLAGVPKAELIEKAVTELRRRQQIDWWKLQFESQVDPFLPVAKETRVLDFRLLVSLEKIVIESRAGEGGDFQPVKTNRLRQLLDVYKTGDLHVTPPSLALWNALADLWTRVYRVDLSLHTSDVTRTVGALLRMPGLEDRVLTKEGVPFVRVAEPLVWQLLPVEDAADDYRLRLVTTDGTPVSAQWLILPGRPVLYMSETTIYQGPAPLNGTGAKDFSSVIPGLALESAAGMQFLAKLGVELPARLQTHAQRATMKVKFIADLKPSYPGATTESLYISAEAVADSGPRREHYTMHGWEDLNESLAPVRKKTNEVFYLYDTKAMDPVPALLESLGAKWSNYDECWCLRLTRNFPEKFIPWLASLPNNIEVLLDKQLATLREAPIAAAVKLDCQSAGVDWFDLQVVLDVKDTELTPEELKILLNARGGYVRLGKKGWRRLLFNLTAEENESLARLGLAADDFSAEPQRMHALQLADHAAARFLPEKQVTAIRRRVDELKTRVAPPVPEVIKASLRPYQVDGYHFLAYLTANRFGGILADDMGLGKTLQTLTWLAWLRLKPGHAKRPSLVVCPKSVMDNWQAEAVRFMPGLRVQLWRGGADAALAPALANLDVLVINYAQLRSLGPTLKDISWLAAILDEGQYIKNPESKTARFALALKADHRLVLTGTPIENRLLDLWSLMTFAMPGVLGNRTQFSKRFDQADDPLARRRLSARVRPFLLRRTKGQVATELPDRVEEDLHCEMEGEQQRLYSAAFKHAQQMLLKIKTKQEFDSQRFNFLTSLLRLRQICCHPALVDKQQINAPSAKVTAMIEVLEPLLEEGHKVLVFSQFVTMIDLLEPLMRERQWPYFRLTGETENRGELVQQFQTLPGAGVFLISLKAGGFGLNLTAASYVVIFDPWWNPAVENQAIDRTHRIGQTRKVMAYRLLIKNSIEEKIRTLQRTKSSLAEDVLGEENFGKALTLEDLKFLFTGDPDQASTASPPATP